MGGWFRSIAVKFAEQPVGRMNLQMPGRVRFATMDAWRHVFRRPWQGDIPCVR